PKPQDGEGQELTARIDTQAPEVDFVSLETSNDGVTDQSRPNHLLAKEGDNLTLYFRTTERIAGVDETVTNSLLEPIVEFKASKDKVFKATVSRDSVPVDSETDESLHKGLHWKAVINIDPTKDTNFFELESDLGFTVKILDPSGNEYSAADNASSMPKPRDENDQKLTARIDTKAPDLSSISFETDNDGMTDSALGESYLLATTGDTLTLRFQTREEIIDPTATDSEDQTRIPSVIFSYTDESGVEVTRSADVSADTGTTNESFIATYQLDSDDTGIESDVNYSISIHDRSGNQREYTDISSVEETVGVSNTLRIDTKAPDLSSISFETDNDGMTDSTRPTILLSKEGDTLTLKFQTNEEVIDEQAVGLNRERIPEVTFKYLNENDEEVQREAIVISSNEVNAIKNRWFVATYTLDGTDSGTESDVDYEIEIHDRSGNIKTFANIASLKISNPSITVSNTFRVDTQAPNSSTILDTTTTSISRVNSLDLTDDTGYVYPTLVSDPITLEFRTSEPLSSVSVSLAGNVYDAQLSSSDTGNRTEWTVTSDSDHMDTDQTAEFYLYSYTDLAGNTQDMSTTPLTQDN
ncbi:MAG: hypothetical protein VX080_09535, partial [SAR324 cluster bacterium]|nr:hypothetical protein [SAR324 cluster bacterium]